MLDTIWRFSSALSTSFEGARFVDSGRIATAGGLTSDIDLALHTVSRYFGEPAVAATAAYMEYSSDAWRTA